MARLFENARCSLLLNNCIDSSMSSYPQKHGLDKILSYLIMIVLHVFEGNLYLQTDVYVRVTCVCMCVHYTCLKVGGIVERGAARC